VPPTRTSVLNICTSAQQFPASRVPLKQSLQKPDACQLTHRDGTSLPIGVGDRPLTIVQTDTGLPPDWEVRHSNSKNLPYYFNQKTHESRWEPPEDADTEKLKVYMAQHHSSAHTRIDGAAAEGKIRAAHLLVKHKDSRRPSSWRETNITRSKDEAIAMLKGYEGQIRSGQKTLGDLAVAESDCSSARKRGDLGFFGKGQMQKEFEDAAFALQPGEMSGVVETASGVHLIQR